MDENGEVCLGLGLGLPDQFSSERRDINVVPLPQNKNKNKRLLFLDLSITSIDDHHAKQESMSNFLSKEDDQDINYSMNFGRKKLRLSRDQTTLLEDSFRQHTTLNLAQKQTLAARLNLKPRQVEVWFQNRRARTKLKQTEVEYEMLKKKCERLSEENRRLKKEVLELRSSMEKQPQAGTDRGGGEREEATAEVVHHP